MAYLHCSCGIEHDEPTDEDVLEDNCQCDCGRELRHSKTTDSIVLALIERVEALEAQLLTQREINKELIEAVC